jgi:hypothetical protein
MHGTIALWAAMVLLATATVAAQAPPRPAAPAVEKLGDKLFRVGEIRVDMSRREISVPGKANQATVLEFVANTRGGMKAYESALTLETDAITFNTALVLIGLDKSHARVPTRHFDPTPPEGDAVDIWVEWEAGGKRRRVRVEELLFDRRLKAPLPEGPWVYTGSTFLADGRYMAELDGVLIGFVHSPAPIVENPRAGAVGNYGAVVMNPSLGLLAGTPVTVIVRAVTPAQPGVRE